MRKTSGTPYVSISAAAALDDLLGARAGLTEPVYRSTSPQRGEPRLLDANYLRLDGKDVWFELVLEPLGDSEDALIRCTLAADWDLPHPIQVRLRIGDSTWVGSLEVPGLSVAWRISLARIRDPKNPARVQKPIQLTLEVLD